jgi:hypothetical protein
MLAVLVLGQPGPEFIPQEHERRDLMIVTPVVVLAVDDPGLARMQFQAHLREAASDGIPHLAGLLLTGAVHHRVIAVPLEPDGRELPGHPGIERIMHEQVSQQRGNRRPLRGSPFPGHHGAIRLLERRFKPPLHIQQNPLLARCDVAGDRPEHKVPGHGAGERPDVQIDHSR